LRFSICDFRFADGLTGLARSAEALNTLSKSFQMLLVGSGWIFHLAKGVAWQLTAVAAVGVVPGVD
jgi:hypothetical protein